jgi:tetratricopeptide (TPR) repeat protein
MELLKLSDPSPALRFAGAAAHRITPPDPDLFFEWFRLTGMRGDKEDFQAFVDTLTSMEGAAMLLTVLTENSEDGVNVPETMTERKAELMYQLGMLLSADGREEAAEDAYRIALSLKPDHAWTANNLGYGILERGGDIEEALRLITAAYEQLPDNPSIVDSMGWVLYKLGRLEDTKDEDGVLTRGAVSLLKQAADDRPDNAVLLDHAADALWRAGSPEQRREAQELWRRAEEQLRREVAFLQGADPMTSRMRARSQALLDAVKAKRQAATEGREPPVAPLAEQFKKP